MVEICVWVQMYHPDCFVFIDETGCNSKDHTRTFGYALRGENAQDVRLLHRGTRISAIAAMCTTGILAVDLISGTVNGEKFFDYVRGTVNGEKFFDYVRGSLLFFKIFLGGHAPRPP